MDKNERNKWHEAGDAPDCKFGRWEDKECCKTMSQAKTLPNMNKGPIPSDVLGSYTGTGTSDLQPEQDADDL